MLRLAGRLFHSLGGTGPITVGLSPIQWLAQEMLDVCAEGPRWNVGGEQPTQVGWCSTVEAFVSDAGLRFGIRKLVFGFSDIRSLQCLEGQMQIPYLPV